jgi:hypothetical protein
MASRAILIGDPIFRLPERQTLNPGTRWSRTELQFHSKFLPEHDPAGKPVSTFPGHALFLPEHDPAGKPASIVPGHT